MHRPINNSDRRAAFTLIELLIVMGIIVLVAAVTLPTFKDLLKDQKTSQTARMIQGFAEGARARAIGSGRPVAMVIERMYGDGSRDLEGNDTSVRLSIGEVFPPYEGDWANATAVINDVPGGGTTRGTSYADIALSQAASLWDPVNTLPSGLADVGDSISFGDHRRSYRIIGIEGPNVVPGFVRIYFDNPAFDPYVGICLGEATIFPTNPVRFRIFRKPGKSMVGGVSLPRGMCIDLSCSGSGTSGIQYGTQDIADYDSVKHVPSGYGFIYIVFNPSGNVQEVYYAVDPGTGDSFTHAAGENIHLLIGRTDQVFPAPLAYLGSVVIPSPSLSTRDEIRYNVLDPNNYWVTISPFSGSITSAQVQDQSAFPVVPASTTLTAAQLLQLRISRSRALASSGTQRSDL